MTKSKTEILQIRIDLELLERFQKYTDSEGLSLSAAVRRCMKQMTDNYEAYLARQEAEKLRILNKR